MLYELQEDAQSACKRRPFKVLLRPFEPITKAPLELSI